MNSNRRYGAWAAEADRASGVLGRSQDGLCCETNSLSRRSGEGQGEGLRLALQSLFPCPLLPGGEGEEQMNKGWPLHHAHRIDFDGYGPQVFAVSFQLLERIINHFAQLSSTSRFY